MPAAKIKREMFFQVDGDGLTDIVRRCYIEGERAKALSILYHIDGLPVSDAYAIIEGRKKLTGVGNKMTLVSDNVDIESQAKAVREAKAKIEKQNQAQFNLALDMGRRLYSETDTEDEDDATEPSPPPQPDLTLDAQTGWLSPDGKLYACTYHGHEALAHRLGLEYRGPFAGVQERWLHLQDGLWSEPQFEETQSQIDAIFDWTQKHGKKMPHWLDKDD